MCDGPQYRVLVERSRNTGRAKEALVEATNNHNLKELQEAIGVRRDGYCIDGTDDCTQKRVTP